MAHGNPIKGATMAQGFDEFSGFASPEDLNRLVKELQPKLKAPEEVHLQVRVG